MDEKKKGAMQPEEGTTGWQASGEVRGSRDLSESERAQLLHSYTAGGEEERASAWDPAGGFSASAGSSGGVGDGLSSPGGMTSGGFSAASGDRPGEFSGSGASFSSPAGRADEPSHGGGKVASAKEKVKEKAAEAKGKVAQSARAQVDQRKEQVAERLEGLPGQLQEKVSVKADELIGQVASMADDYVGRATQLLRERDADDLMRMAKDEFRARPMAVAAGCFALGFLGARLLRS